jgi:hypothetical protein
MRNRQPGIWLSDSNRQMVAHRLAEPSDRHGHDGVLSLPSIRTYYRLNGSAFAATVGALRGSFLDANRGNGPNFSLGLILDKMR